MDFEGWGTRQHTGTTRRRMETLMGGGYLEIEISARSEDRLTYVRGLGEEKGETIAEPRQDLLGSSLIQLGEELEE